MGSPTVFVNGLPALRVGDQGVHMACCGPNMWWAAKGSPTVLINGMPAHRLGDMQTHCGGVGQLVTGSPNVIVGESGSGSGGGGGGAGGPAGAFQSAARGGTPCICKGGCKDCQSL